MATDTDFAKKFIIFLAVLALYVTDFAINAGKYLVYELCEKSLDEASHADKGKSCSHVYFPKSPGRHSPYFEAAERSCLGWSHGIPRSHCRLRYGRG